MLSIMRIMKQGRGMKSEGVTNLDGIVFVQGFTES